MTIRRRQNNESAKRCRERRATEMSIVRRKYEQTCERIHSLESTIGELCSAVGVDVKLGDDHATRRGDDGVKVMRGGAPF